MKSLWTIVSRSVLIAGLGLATTQAAVAQYSTTILKDKPVAYYRLGESTGSTVATDSSPNGFNGAYERSPELGVPGLINDPNTAVDFTNGDVVINDNPALDFVSVPFSIEAWFSVTQFGPTNARIFDKIVAGAANGYGLDIGPNNIRMLGNVDVQPFVNLTAGTTYHIVCVSNGTG